MWENYVLIGLLILSAIHIQVMTKVIEKIGDEHLETMEELSLALRRENYLMKTMNDAMSVSDIAGFMSQRMRNAPKEFKPKSKEEINPDNIKS